MIKITDTEMIGPSVRDVAIFGPDVFPGPWCWAEVRFSVSKDSLMQEIQEWCITTIGYKHFWYSRGIWFFTYKDDAILFSLTWM